MMAFGGSQFVLELLDATNFRDVVVAGNCYGIRLKNGFVLIIQAFDSGEQDILDWAQQHGCGYVENILYHCNGFDIIICNMAQ